MTIVTTILITLSVTGLTKQIMKDRKDYFDWLNGKNQYKTKNI